jgi:hypothetical protein
MVKSIGAESLLCAAFGPFELVDLQDLCSKCCAAQQSIVEDQADIRRLDVLLQEVHGRQGFD